MKIERTEDLLLSIWMDCQMLALVSLRSTWPCSGIHVCLDDHCRLRLVFWVRQIKSTQSDWSTTSRPQATTQITKIDDGIGLNILLKSSRVALHFRFMAALCDTAAAALRGRSSSCSQDEGYREKCQIFGKCRVALGSLLCRRHARLK